MVQAPFYAVVDLHGWQLSGTTYSKADALMPSSYQKNPRPQLPLDIRSKNGLYLPDISKTLVTLVGVLFIGLVLLWSGLRRGHLVYWKNKVQVLGVLLKLSSITISSLPPFKLQRFNHHGYRQGQHTGIFLFSFI